jgi:hypothetical protein
MSLLKRKVKSEVQAPAAAAAHSRLAWHQQTALLF